MQVRMHNMGNAYKHDTRKLAYKPSTLTSLYIAGVRHISERPNNSKMNRQLIYIFIIFFIL